MADIKYNIFKEDAERNQTLLESFYTPEEAYNYCEDHRLTEEMIKNKEKFIIKEVIEWENN